jgi:hypothetical protein
MVPYYWSSPVAIEVSVLPTTVPYVSVPHDDTVVVISIENVPTSVPAAAIIHLPTT